MRNVLVAAMLLSLATAGCLTGTDDVGETEGTSTDSDHEYRYAEGDYIMEGEWSTPLQPALYEMLPGEKVHVAVRDGVEMSVAIFRPDKPGCDWASETLLAECQLPVVFSASPYYTTNIGQPSGRPPLPEWLVPRDFIAVQMALRGTGESGGCMEYKDPKDVTDISDVIDWVADQPWSNGNVGVAGRSYVGTSAWAAAASGNENVKTIMPISGAVSSPQLLFRNGTHETRALIPHIPIYWASYAFLGSGTPVSANPDPADPRVDTHEDSPYHMAGNLCPEIAEPHVHAPIAAATADASDPFWQSRDLRQAILDDYQGSAWVIHGMTDFNVDPSQAVPFINEMMDAGIPTAAMLGQWNHHYPDNTEEHWNVRWDWSTMIVDWFNYWLREEGDMPRLGVEVEDDTYRWRHEDRYPPAHVDWQEFELATGSSTHAQAYETTWTVSEKLHVAGLIRLPLMVSPGGPGGQLAAELFDDTAGKRIGWGVIDLRNSHGGNTDPQTVTPSLPLTAYMQFEPADGVVAEGSTLRLVIGRDGVADINPDSNTAPISILEGTLQLPTVEATQFMDIPLTEDDPRFENTTASA